MSKINIQSIAVALNSLNPTAKKLVIVPKGKTTSQTNIAVIELKHDFNIQDALALIGDVKYIGVLNPDAFYTSSITELMNILTNENKAAVISINPNDISYKDSAPKLQIGDKLTAGNYEYSYGQEYLVDEKTACWTTVCEQEGFGVRVIDNTQTNYESPLTKIQGYPVTNMTNLFAKNEATLLNLINWDTCNITDMYGMFSESQATRIRGLNNFNTASVTDMGYMFCEIDVTTLDLSGFDTSKVTRMSGMFESSLAISLDLSNFDTANVTDMSGMFYCSQATRIDLSSFDTSKVTNMNGMFSDSQATNLDLSSFDTSKVTDMYDMFSGSQATRIDLSSFDTANVTNMYEMFYESQTTSIDVSSFDTSKAKNSKQVFAKSNVRNLISNDKMSLKVYKGFCKTQPTITMKSNDSAIAVPVNGIMRFVGQTTFINSLVKIANKVSM